MGLGGILILLLLLVSLIVFIYVLVVTARGWGVLHTVLLSFLFIECWVFIAFSAGVQYRRVNATKEAHVNRERADRAEEQTQQLLWGDYGVSLAEDAVIPVKGKLRRLTSDRGRVWRRVELLQSDPGSYQLELSTVDAVGPGEVDPLLEDPEAVAAAPAQPTSESLPVDTVVYAFAEELSPEGRPIPVYYLGEFTVNASQAGQITLEPTLQLFPDQQQRIASGGASTWTLYELLPLDSHETFAAPGSQPSEEEAFGRMDAESIGDLFASVPQEDGRHEELIASYVRDGQQASDNDRPEDVWLQVEVLKEFELDVDSQETANATERGYFDSLGRSIDLRLKRTGEGESQVVKLTPEMRGKPILLPQGEDTQRLIDEGKVKVVRRVYVRPLNDYEEAFNHHFVRSHEVNESIALFQRDSAEIEKANQRGQEMISFRQVENQALQADLRNYRKEVELLEAAVADSAEDYQRLKAQLSRLYRAVQASRTSFSTAAN